MLVSTLRQGLVALTVVVCLACDSDFSPYNEIEGFRLLAIGADPPALSGGGRVELSALVVGGGRATYRWRWCPVTEGVATAHRCALGSADLPDGLPSLELGTSTTAELSWPTEARSTAELCVLVQSQPAPMGAKRFDCASPRPEIYVGLEVTAEDGTTIQALRPLALAAAGFNQNPRIEEIRIQGEAAPGVVLPLELGLDQSQAEPTAEGPREILRATWFVEGGEVEDAHTTFIEGDPTATWAAFQANAWTLPNDRAEARMHLVLRDDRGGLSWQSRTIDLKGVPR